MISFQLCLYNYSNGLLGALQPLDEILQRNDLAARFEDHTYRLTSAGFLVRDDSRILLGYETYWGQINLLILQMEAALRRLAVDRMALIRAVNLQYMEGPFLAIEPEGSSLLLSLFYIPEAGFPNVYPIAGPGDAASDEIHAFFETRRAELLRSKWGTPFHPVLLEYRVDRDTMVYALANESELGRDLYERLGQKLTDAIDVSQLDE